MKKNSILLLVSSLLLFSCSSTISPETINYKSFVETILTAQKNEKLIFIFTQPTCSSCKQLEPFLSDYLKNDLPKDVQIYSVSIHVIVEDGIHIFEDETMGNQVGSSTDCLKKLDNRIIDYASATYTSSKLLFPLVGSTYRYISTPLFIWYNNQIEYKISNTFVDSCSENNEISYELFKDFMEFPDSPNIKWNSTFNLTYND